MEYQLFLKLIKGLIAVGGLGFMNYAILDRLNITDIYSSDKQITTFYTLWWTLIDYGMYLLIHAMISRFFSEEATIIVSFIVTVCVSLVITVIFAFPLNKLINWLLAFVLQRNGHAPVDKGSVWSHLLGDNKETMAYLYDFNHNPLGWGYIKMASSDEKSNYSLVLQPFNQEKGIPQDTYDEITRTIQKEDFRKQYIVNQFVDFKQQFIVITVQNNN